MNQMLPHKQQDKNSMPAYLLTTLLLSSAVSAFLYFTFFASAPFIWAQNHTLPLSEYTLWTRIYYGNLEGIEIYVLYLCMFLNITLTVLMAQWLARLSGGWRYLFLAMALLITCLYYGTIGFTPPIMGYEPQHSGGLKLKFTGWHYFFSFSGVLLLMLKLSFVEKRFPRFTPWLVALLITPVCFIATQPYDTGHYNYVFAPALRVANGVKFSEIYFQYDIFLSMLAAAWMKLKLDLNGFQVVGQFSYFLFILASYLFARKLLVDRTLPVYFLISLVLLRIYAALGDPVAAFQGTPFRLDIWLVLLALVYLKGPTHWLTGVFCGLMILFHKVYGIIYVAAYIQLLLALVLIDCYPPDTGARRSLIEHFVRHLRSWWHNLLIIAIAFIVGILWLKSAGLRSDSPAYLTFLKISRTTFFWYIPVLFSFTTLLLLKVRHLITANYLATGLLLVFLNIGNSLYFFGRSHDCNILSISGSLVLLFFLCLDMVGIIFSGSQHRLLRHASVTVAALFVLATSLVYGDKIAAKVLIQYTNAAKGELIYPPETPSAAITDSLASIRAATGNSKKVYFVSYNDFLYYYYGGYEPVGYHFPYLGWSLNRELAFFLKNLVNSGYFLVIDYPNLIAEVIAEIPYTRTLTIDNLVILWRE